MASLDHNYITDLVAKAQIGDSNAFAELYAATCQQIYAFSCRYLTDTELAKRALKDTYVLALKTLLSLQDPALFITWLNQLSFQTCYGLRKAQQKMQQKEGEPLPANAVQIDSREYVVDQILKLPFTESQVILLKYEQNLRNRDIARILDISRGSVRRYLTSGKMRLLSLSQN